MQPFYPLLSIALLGIVALTFVRLRQVQYVFSPIFGWLLGLTVFAVIPLCLLAFNGGYSTPAVYNNAGSFAHISLADPALVRPFLLVWSSLAGIFATVLILALGAVPRRPRGPAVEEPALRRFLYCLMIVACVDFAVNMWMLGGVYSFFTSHWYLREERELALYGTLAVVLTHAEQGLQALFTAGAMLHANWQVQNRRFFPWINFWVGLFLLAEVVVTGNRIFMAIFLVALAACLWYHRRRRAIVALLLFAPVILVVFSLWSSVRHNLVEATMSLPAYLHANFGNRLMTVLMDSTEGIDAMLLLRVMQDFGQSTPYLYGQTYMRGLTFFMPHRFAPDRSTGFSLLLAQDYLPVDITSLNATEIGEMYANFGAWCLILAPAFTLVIYLWSLRAFPAGRGAVTEALTFLCAFWCSRVTAEDGFILFLVSWALFCGLLAVWPGLRDRSEVGGRGLEGAKVG